MKYIQDSLTNNLIILKRFNYYAKNNLMISQKNIKNQLSLSYFTLRQ